MTVTFFSFITSILLCNVFIIFIAFMRRRNSFLIRFSLVPLALLIAAVIIRLVCFVEFPYTAVVGSEIILPAVLDFFTIQLLNAYNGAVTIHIYDVLLAVWVIGSVYNLQKYVRQSIRFNKSISSIRGTEDMRIISCMYEILAESRKNAEVKIIQSEEIRIPMISGFFRPVIYLPVMQLSDDELKNILLHEWTHFLRKDAWIKLSMCLISLVFWWNPFVHLLKHELNHILEIQCDLSITSQMNEKARINYLESILSVIRAAGENNFCHTIPADCTALVSTNKPNKIEQRFNLVLDYGSGKKQRIFPTVLLCALILVILFVSYNIVIQPRTFSTAKAGYEETFTITPENSYLTINGDGTYSLYSDGTYRCDIPQINEEPFSLYFDSLLCGGSALNVSKHNL